MTNPQPAVRVDARVKALPELSRDDLQRRAQALLVLKGWKPGDTISLHGAIGLMVDLAADAVTNPLDRCAHPECGCDFDAVCNDALTPAPTEAGGVSEPTKAVIAALAAAISLLERTPRAKKAAPSDRMFDQMLTDYRKALEDGRAALSSTPAADAGWQDDPASDDRWNAGVDFAMTQLCAVLDVDPASVNWDAATETLDGDVQSVIGNIMRACHGEEWSPSAVFAPPLGGAR